jgi:hypothetical protein
MDKCTVEDIALYAMITLSIWFRRNTVIHGGVFTHPSRLIQESTTFLHAYNIVEAKVGDHAIHYQPNLPLKWNMPPHGWYKINWDVTIDAINKRMGIGIIVRDCSKKPLIRL